MKRAVIGDDDWGKLNGNSLGTRQNEEKKNTHKKSLAFYSQRGWMEQNQFSFYQW